MPVGDENIGPAIVIGIEESRAPTDVRDAGLSQSGSHTDVVKALRSAVPIKRIRFLREVADEQIQPAIVVEVTELHTHRTLFMAISADGSTREHAHIFKSSVVLIAIQIVRSGIVGDIQIRPAIIVIIGPNAL